MRSSGCAPLAMDSSLRWGSVSCICLAGIWGTLATLASRTGNCSSG
jgi:hypothetical protein